MSVNRNTYCRCLFYTANALSRLMTRMAEEEFAPTGFNPSYAFVLMTVNKQPGITAGEIANIMQIQPSTLTRFVEKLEKDGYLNRQTQGKYTLVYPSPKGERQQEFLQLAWKNLYERYAKVLGAETSANLAAEINQACIALESSMNE